MFGCALPCRRAGTRAPILTKAHFRRVSFVQVCSKSLLSESDACACNYICMHGGHELCVDATRECVPATTIAWTPRLRVFFFFFFSTGFSLEQRSCFGEDTCHRWRYRYQRINVRGKHGVASGGEAAHELVACDCCARQLCRLV